MGSRQYSLGELDGLGGGVELELHPAAVAACANLHRAPERGRERVLRRGQRLGEVGMDVAAETLPLRLRLTLSFARSSLRVTHRPAVVSDVERQLAPLGVVLA